MMFASPELELCKRILVQQNQLTAESGELYLKKAKEDIIANDSAQFCCTMVSPSWQE